MRQKLGTTLLILMVLLASAQIHPARALGYTVNTTDDVDDGTCDTTHCSLREAINAANSSSFMDIIAFDIIPKGDPGCSGGVCTIQPTTALPPLTDNGIVIDGYTQKNATPATRQSPAVIVIVIDGTSAPPPCAGLEVNSSGNTISGLAIGNFTYGISLQGSGATNNTITGNYVGTDASGTLARGNTGYGVGFEHAPRYNVIGGDEPAERNVISGNGEGVVIAHTDTMSNTISGNYIGIDASGTLDLGNDHFGILVNSASYSTIGGDSAGGRNVISGNEDDGINLIDGANTIIKGNLIGTVADGSAMPNGIKGICVRGESDDVVIGPDNVIAYNGRHGVEVTGSTSDNTHITRNSIHSNGGWAIYNTDAIPRPSIFDAKEPSSVVGVACAGCTVEVFANPGIDWEGRTFIGDTQADGSGAFTVTVPIAAVLSAPYLTATATDVYSGTSLFSPIYVYPLEYSYLPLAMKGN
jgi:CSLREA domain-containing protein